MSTLVTEPQIEGADDLYDRLMAMHDGRSDAESHRLNGRLILLLINHIGDEDVVLEAIRLAGARG